MGALHAPVPPRILEVVRLALAQMSLMVFPGLHMVATHANEHSPPAADAKPLEAFSERSP